MFHIIEFSKRCGGGLGLVREEWLTPRKKESFWPPYKAPEKYNKCLLSGQPPSDDWNLYEVERMFYSTDDLLKARQKLKEAEVESEIGTDAEVSGEYKRKRKPSKKLFDSSSSDSDYEVNQSLDIFSHKKISLPQPPKKFSTPHISNEGNVGSATPHNSRSTSHHTKCSTPLGQLPVEVSDGEDVPGTSSTSKHSSTQQSLSLRLPVPRTETTVLSPGFDVIAQHLAKINSRLSDIENTQKEILEHLCCSKSTVVVSLPDELNLPCDSVDDLNHLEEWLLDENNKQNLTTNLSLLGGKKVAQVVRKVLEKLFPNAVAELYNWTGKNKKYPLKDLTVTKLIPGIVRRQKNLSNCTDDAIYEVMSNWFRFTKDRNGGRESRRKAKTGQQPNN